MMRRDNSEKIIIDLCGGTGAWSAPYKAAGYDVHNITLPKYNVFHRWLYDDCIVFYYLDGEIPRNLLTCNISNIKGILAAPPCDQFSVARNRHKTPRDIVGGFLVVKACLEIIWHCSLFGNLRFWCLENPKGLLIHLMGRPAFRFERWEFDDIGAKQTLLWGDFKIPKKKPNWQKRDTSYIADWCYHDVEIPSDYVRPKGMCLKKIKRSMTPQGFAAAFFAANP